jgi:hypothetical protein
MIKGVDYSTRPANWGAFFDALRDRGYTVIGRYLYDFDDPKRVTREELDAAFARGIDCFFWFETSEQSPLGGYDRGVAHAQRAMAQLKALGLPETTPVYYCIDWDATSSQLANQVRAYFRGVRSEAALAQIGVYGGYRQVKFILEEGLAKYAAQTEAWSYLNGLWPIQPVWHKGAQIHQWTVRGPGKINGVQCDGLDIMAEDIGAVGPEKEEDMVLTHKEQQALAYAATRSLSNQFDIAILSAKQDGNAAEVKRLTEKKARDVAKEREFYKDWLAD